MIGYRCFLCSVRIGRKHVMHASFLNGQRHMVRLCYECGVPDFEGSGRTLSGAQRWMVRSCKAVDAKLREIKTLEV